MDGGYVHVMPSKVHDGLVQLIRDRPALAAELITEALPVTLPSYTTARLESADSTDVSSTPFRADAVIALDGPERTSAAIVTEIQRRRDEDKHFSWPVYLATLRARLRCPVLLLVISPSQQIANWCAEPIDCGHPGWILHPFAIGPDQIPTITDHDQAIKSPELTLLSAIAHGPQPDGRKTIDAAVAAITSLDRDRGRVYHDIVLAALPKAARRYLESLMADTGYVFQSEFALRHQAEGKAEGEADALLTVLAARGIAVSDSIRERITGCRDLPQLKAWITKAVTAKTADELFF
jgi:hypothetical protein